MTVGQLDACGTRDVAELVERQMLTGGNARIRETDTRLHEQELSIMRS